MTLMLRDQENIEKGIELGRVERPCRRPCRRPYRGACGRTSGWNPADGVRSSGFWDSQRGNSEEDRGKVPAYGTGTGRVFQITGCRPGRLQ